MKPVIPPEDFLDMAQRLEPGVSKKIAHNGCSSSAAMIISNDRKGFSATCFKCGGHGFVPHGYLSLHEQNLYRQAAEKERRKQNGSDKITLPVDFSRSIPEAGLVWLWKYGITDEEIATFHIGWSEELKRVILPVYMKGKLVYWQGRSVSPAVKPKYLNIGSKTNGTVYFSRHAPRTRRQAGDIKAESKSHQLHDDVLNTIVLVEDVLSAIKVGRCTTAVSFLGSSINSSAYAMLRSYSRVRLWYDNDPAGEKARSIYRRVFGGLVPADDIRTPLDPKCYSTRKIQEILDAHNAHPPSDKEQGAPPESAPCTVTQGA